MCKKKGLGQQALADAFGMKRGKVAGYFYETQPKSDFFERLGDKFQLDIGKFLTIEMNEGNYESFFTNEGVQTNGVDQLDNVRTKQNAFDLLMKLKRSSDEEERNNLIDELILIHGRTLDEISTLKDDINELKDQLLNNFRS